MQIDADCEMERYKAELMPLCSELKIMYSMEIAWYGNDYTFKETQSCFQNIRVFFTHSTH